MNYKRIYTPETKVTLCQLHSNRNIVLKRRKPVCLIYMTQVVKRMSKGSLTSFRSSKGREYLWLEGTVEVTFGTLWRNSSRSEFLVLTVFRELCKAPWIFIIKVASFRKMGYVFKPSQQSYEVRVRVILGSEMTARPCPRSARVWGVRKEFTSALAASSVPTGGPPAREPHLQAGDSRRQAAAVVEVIHGAIPLLWGI